MNELVQQLTDNIVAVEAALIALVLGWFSMKHLSGYMSRRRQMRKQERWRDQQRMAAMVKGLHYAGVSKDIFSEPTANWRDHVLRGLRWLFGAAGLSSALYAYACMQPSTDPASAARAALAGVVPCSIGLAHLLCAVISRKWQGL